MKKRVALLLTFLWLASCVTTVGHEFDAQAIDRLTPGHTTEDEAVAILGGKATTHMTWGDDGSYLAVWTVIRSRHYSTDSEMESVSIVFDHNGTMVRVLTTLSHDTQ